MRKNGKAVPLWKQALVILVLIAFTSVSTAPFAATDSVCAEVKIVINQKLSFERQAFDAKMVISNGLTDDALTNVDIDLLFFDRDNQPVAATQDPNASDALFFYRIDSLSGIDNLDGGGVIAENTEAEIHWLIIPTAGAAGSEISGKIYYVGARITYTHTGETQTVEVTPDFIRVKPLPELTLDYFLPHDVYGDDPFTPQVEPVVPFTLGVRVQNNGFAASNATQIESAQIKIVENKQDLLVGFKILASYVANQSVNNSLTLDFGDILPNTAKVGRWLMTASLSGKFTEFNATFTHADSLGGALTSVLKAVNTHRLVQDVKVDLPGRDEVLDFLALDGDVLRVYESEGVDTAVQDRSSTAALSIEGESAQLDFTPEPGFVYVKVDDPMQGKAAVEDIVRSDGKKLPAENLWLSQTRNDDLSLSYFVNLFDADSTGSYTFNYFTDDGITRGIKGYFYYDLNRNGRKEANEPGIEGLPTEFEHYAVPKGEYGWHTYERQQQLTAKDGQFFYRYSYQEAIAKSSAYGLRPNSFAMIYRVSDHENSTIKTVSGELRTVFAERVPTGLRVTILINDHCENTELTYTAVSDEQGFFSLDIDMPECHNFLTAYLQPYDVEFITGYGRPHSFTVAVDGIIRFIQFNEDYSVDMISESCKTFDMEVK